MKLPPLKSLPVFEAVARLNSFSLAAEELAVSQSAVSHQIKQLETYLGEPLFQRTGRYLQLTEQGRQYQEVVTSSLLEIQRASEQLLGREQSRLRLSVYSSFAVRWLVPRLPALQQACPQLDLSLEMTGENPVLSDRVGDCFITIHQTSAAFDYELLYEEQLFPVVSRDFWQTLVRQLDLDPEQPELQPEDLAAFPLLSTASIYQRPQGDWQAWYQAAGKSLPASARLQHFSHMLLALEAARFHQGIALTNDYMLSNRKDAEDFVRLPGHAVRTGDRFYFAWKQSRYRETGIRQLRQWLVREAAATGLLSS
ncbi:LysR family transcriptional regulator [Marinospirillum perlucidum]|uniref:LysR family transcriptional regulator n=1 Tax=Marinospirillum perlucidum TaxID=1982602 RepID=UPI000DF2F6D7|nr:LysR family transcriptional regulator [Marinospirillum perlucidum]